MIQVWLTIVQAAKVCNVKPATVRRWVALGQLSRQPNGKIRGDELLKFWDERMDAPMVLLAFRRWDRIPSPQGAKSVHHKALAPASTGPGRGRLEGVDVADYSALSDCTVQTAAGDFCRAASLDDSPFPICEQHAQELFTHMARSLGLAGLTHQAMVDYLAPSPEARAAAAVRQEARADLQQEASQVYYIEMPSGRIKIGYTTNMTLRLTNLRVPSTAILATEPGGPDLERQRHKEFAKFRHGRWEFEPDITLLAHAQRVRNQHGVTITTWGGVVREKIA